MARSADEDSRRSAERADINHAISEMHHAMSDFYHRRHRLTMAGQNPETDKQLQELFLEFYTAVMHAFTKLRPHIKVHLEDDYWSTTEYPELAVEAPEHDDADEDGEIGGLRLMDHWHDMTASGVGEDYRRHEGTVERAVFYADLPHHSVLQRVANLLHEASDNLGFGAQPSKRTPRTEITEDLLEDVEEWRQNMLDEIDSPEAFEEWLQARQEA